MRRVLASLVVLGMIAVGCGNPGGEVSEEQTHPTGGAESPGVGRETERPVTTRESGSFDELRHAADHMEVWALTLTVAIDEHIDVPGDPHSRSAELLATLDGLLRKHTVLVGYASDAAVGEHEDTFLAAADAVNANTDELAREFTALYDQSTGEEFKQLWEKQVHAYLRYADGVLLEDEPTKQAAAEELEKFVEDFAEFIVDITGGIAKHDEIEKVTDEHVKSTLELIERWPEGEEDAFTALKDATDVMKEMAEKLAKPIAEGHRMDGDVTSEAAKLRAELSGRMLENPSFLGFATKAVFRHEAGGGSRPVFDHARSLVEKNTEELTEIVRKHLGDDTASRFEELWTEHDDLFVDYTEAAEADEQGDRERVLEELADWSKDLGELLGNALGDAISASAVESEAAKHVETVIATIDAQEEALGAASS